MMNMLLHLRNTLTARGYLPPSICRNYDEGLVLS